MSYDDLLNNTNIACSSEDHCPECKKIILKKNMKYIKPYGKHLIRQMKCKKCGCISVEVYDYLSSAYYGRI